MRLLDIGSNQVVQVDDADFDALSKIQWRFDGRYAYTFDQERKLYMHQMLCTAELVDHVDQNKLNNQRENLKASNQQLNQYNRKTRCKGVHFNKNAKKWEAYVTIYGVKRYLGLHASEEQALATRKRVMDAIRSAR